MRDFWPSCNLDGCHANNICNNGMWFMLTTWLHRTWCGPIIDIWANCSLEGCHTRFVKRFDSCWQLALVNSPLSTPLVWIHAKSLWEPHTEGKEFPLPSIVPYRSRLKRVNLIKQKRNLYYLWLLTQQVDVLKCYSRFLKTFFFLGNILSLVINNYYKNVNLSSSYHWYVALFLGSTSLKDKYYQHSTTP